VTASVAVLQGCASLISINDVSQWEPPEAGGSPDAMNDVSQVAVDGADVTSTDVTSADATDGGLDSASDGDSAGDDADTSETSVMDSSFDVAETLSESDALADTGPADAPMEVCTPIATSVACAGANCGTIDNGCGTPISCGNCGSYETCSGDGGPSLCQVEEDGGCTPSARYVILDPGNGVGGSGTGLVRDNSTGLTWTRFDYTEPNAGEPEGETDCMNVNINMRLPTETEALGIAGSNQDSCAWPAGWDTWTSTVVDPYGWYVVTSGGSIDDGYISNYGDILCVE
jgi:hypothetical protein